MVAAVTWANLFSLFLCHLGVSGHAHLVSALCVSFFSPLFSVLVWPFCAHTRFFISCYFSVVVAGFFLIRKSSLLLFFSLCHLCSTDVTIWFLRKNVSHTKKKNLPCRKPRKKKKIAKHFSLLSWRRNLNSFFCCLFSFVCFSPILLLIFVSPHPDVHPAHGGRKKTISAPFSQRSKAFFSVLLLFWFFLFGNGVRFSEVAYCPFFRSRSLSIGSDQHEKEKQKK